MRKPRRAAVIVCRIHPVPVSFPSAVSRPGSGMGPTPSLTAPNAVIAL